MASTNQQLEARVKAHAELYGHFWDNPYATPDELVAAFGQYATQFLAAAGESVEHIARLAAIAGKTLTDFLPAENWTMRRQAVVNPDGSCSLEPPAEGYDVHGLPIPGWEPPTPPEEPPVDPPIDPPAEPSSP